MFRQTVCAGKIIVDNGIDIVRRSFKSPHPVIQKDEFFVREQARQFQHTPEFTGFQHQNSPEIERVDPFIKANGLFRVIEQQRRFKLSFDSGGGNSLIKLGNQ